MMIKRITAIVMALLLLMTMSMTATAEAVIPRAVVIQWQDEWKNYYYGGQNLYDTGCGVFSTVNAVGYLTGNEMSVVEVADWAYEVRALNYYAGGTDLSIFFPKLQGRFGEEYGFTVADGVWQGVSSTTLKNHLKNGGVAVARVPGHYIALVGYESSTGYFHVYDSAPSSARGTGNGDAWVSESWLTTSAKLKVDWYCMLTRTGTVINRPYGGTSQTGTIADKCGTYRVATETLNVRYGPSTDYTAFTTVHSGDLLNVTELASNGWGKFKTSSGVDGWSNVSYYGAYIGVDALACDVVVTSGAITYTYYGDGSMVLTNNGSTAASAELILPQGIGTLTTPYFGIHTAPLYGNGYGFGFKNSGSGYTMMRDCYSGDQLVEETSAPYMKTAEKMEIDLSDWWKPASGDKIDRVRIDLAASSSLKINYLYFAAESGVVTDTSYNLPRTATAQRGDVTGDGVVSTSDARAIIAHLSGGKTLVQPALLAADYNGDNEVTTTDVRLLLKDVAAV
ncbi:MAG: SH3 domain-containing protein [Clostridia bacterium]|nr:SH3 domain-containing protein [Clostridia bacterium]